MPEGFRKFRASNALERMRHELQPQRRAPASVPSFIDLEQELVLLVPSSPSDDADWEVNQ